MSWNYFSRLWCIYEWACFLVAHNFTKVELGCDSSLRRSPTETLPKFIESVEAISVDQADCFNKGDHAILEAKVAVYYEGADNEESFKNFERFAKVTAIALMAKSIILWRARGEDGNEWLQPLVQSASNMGFYSLQMALQNAEPRRWWEEDCDRNLSNYKKVVMDWFLRRIVPLLNAEKKSAVRPEYLKQARDSMISNQDGMSRIMTTSLDEDFDLDVAKTSTNKSMGMGKLMSNASNAKSIKSMFSGAFQRTSSNQQARSNDAKQKVSGVFGKLFSNRKSSGGPSPGMPRSRTMGV